MILPDVIHPPPGPYPSLGHVRRAGPGHEATASLLRHLRVRPSRHGRCGPGVHALRQELRPPVRRGARSDLLPEAGTPGGRHTAVHAHRDPTGRVDARGRALPARVAVGLRDGSQRARRGRWQRGRKLGAGRRARAHAAAARHGPAATGARARRHRGRRSAHLRRAARGARPGRRVCGGRRRVELREQLPLRRPQ